MWVIITGIGNGVAFIVMAFALMVIGFGGDETTGAALVWFAVALAGGAHVALAVLFVVRLWDAGRSGWWALLGVALLAPVYWTLYAVPLVWLSALTVSACLPSRPSARRR